MTSLEPITFEVFYGVSSPWAFFGAPEVTRLATKFNITPILRPIIIIEENGGIPLRTRPQARQDYHEVELERWSKRHGVPLNPKPRFYPLPSGKIEISAQAIIRVQNRLEKGNELVQDFSYAIQRGLWVEEKDLSKVDTIEEIAISVGLDESLAREISEDRTKVKDDPAVLEWRSNLKAAEDLGIFGTPTYVVNGELFWGQDRLSFVEERLQELTKIQQADA